MSDKSPIIGPSEKPRHTIELAANAAIDAAEAYLEEHRLEIKEMYVSIHAEGDPEHLFNAVSAGRGLDDPRDVFAFLVTQAMGVGRQLGITIKILPLKGPVGRG